MRVRARHCPEEPDAESARILSGIAEWCPDGIRHKADRRHVREAACLARRRVRRPCRRAPAIQCGAEDSEKLGASAACWFREPAAKPNFAAQDGPGAQYAAKEVRRLISAPTVGTLRKLRRLARYLRGAPRMRLWRKRQTEQGVVTAVAVANYAGRDGTRRSANGGA